MADGIIPDEVRRFLHHYIDSVAQWEGLLVLKAEPDEVFDAGAMASRLYVPESEAASVLQQLAMRGLITANPDKEASGFLYRPASPDIAALIEQTAELYRAHLIAVTNVIHERPITGVKAFANAFRLRKD